MRHEGTVSERLCPDKAAVNLIAKIICADGQIADLGSDAKRRRTRLHPKEPGNTIRFAAESVSAIMTVVF